jgi:peptidoglycan/LPS O-acetylase OafA/YrhL
VGITIATVGAALVSAALEGRTLHVLRIRPLVWVGRVSYGLYLWHQPIMQELRPVLDGPLSVAVLLALSLAAAALSYRLVETPFLRLKDRTRDRNREAEPAARARRPAPAAAPAHGLSPRAG